MCSIPTELDLVKAKNTRTLILLENNENGTNNKSACDVQIRDFDVFM